MLAATSILPDPGSPRVAEPFCSEFSLNVPEEGEADAECIVDVENYHAKDGAVSYMNEAETTASTTRSVGEPEIIAQRVASQGTGSCELAAALRARPDHSDHVMPEACGGTRLSSGSKAATRISSQRFSAASQTTVIAPSNSGKSRLSGGHILRASSRSLGSTASGISVRMPLRALGSVSSKAAGIDTLYSLREPALAAGTFGSIHVGVSNLTGQVFAVKTIPFIGIQKPEMFEKELAISRRLKHPNIIRLHDTVRDDDKRMWNLVMEYCTGGDLFDWLGSSGAGCSGRVLETTLARYLREMLAGVKYCHSHRFCHRDIKVENYMLESPDPAAPLKLIDFGLACAFSTAVPMKLRCGTTHYSAPQVLQESYSEKCDIWSVGICFHMICVGCWPFYHEDEKTLAVIIATEPEVFGQEKYNCDTTARWERIPGNVQAMKDVVIDLLQTDEGLRPSAKDVMRSNAWLKACLTPEEKKKQETRKCCSVL